MKTIDGSHGEGGGQILRSALSLSLLTGTPFRLINVRANRSRPGLLRQHLTALIAAAEIGEAKISGASVGSREVTFSPSAVNPGSYSFVIGTAGNTSLVFQTIFLPLLLAGAPSEITIEGGTHNAHAPPFEFLKETFLPCLALMGAKVEALMVRAGFYPAGGGRVQFRIEPLPKLAPLRLMEPWEISTVEVTGIISKLPHSIAEREITVIKQRLPYEHSSDIRTVESVGQGNYVIIKIRHGELTELVSSIGEKGLLAEIVAERAANEAKAFIDSRAPIGVHLADQLLLPLALAGEGGFVTSELTLHARTNMHVIEQFLPVTFTTLDTRDGRIMISVHRS